MGERILLVPKGFFGDVVLITPVIAALKESNPGFRISLVCDPQMVPLVGRDPLVDEAIPFDRAGRHAGWKGLKIFAAELKSREFDVACSFHRSARTSLLLYKAGIPRRIGFADAGLRGLYTESVSRLPVAHDVLRNVSLVESMLSERVREQLALLDHKGPQPGNGVGRLRLPSIESSELSPRVREVIEQRGAYAVVVPGSAWETKRWSAAEFRSTAAALVREYGLKVIVTGTQGEQEVCERVACDLEQVENMSGKTSLLDLIALIRGASVVVCNDSVALHIASAAATPVAVVFCSTSPRFGFGPWGTEARVFEKDGLFCKPCGRHGRRSCPSGTSACMTGVSSSDVVAAVAELLNQREQEGAARHLHVIHQ